MSLSPETREKLIDGLCRNWRLSKDEAQAVRRMGDDDESLAHMVTVQGLTWELFRDWDVINEWMREQNKWLDGAALPLIVSGLDGLRKVRDLVDRISNPDFT